MSDDLITALVLRRGALAWTTLQRKKNRLEVVENKISTFEWPAGVTEWQAPEVIERIKPLCAQIKGRVALALPTDAALLRVVRLPTVEAEEIRDMVALQVDKFSPFPVDQMAVSQEILHQHEGASRVAIVAAPLDTVSRWGAALQAVELFPREVDVEVLGWWRLLKQEKQIPETGRHLLLLMEESGAELLVVQDGVPVLMRALGHPAAGTSSEAASELAEELNYTLTTLEAEWGSGGVQAIQLWQRGAASTEFLEQLRAACQLEVETHQLDRLPSLSEGLARRSAERGPHLVDLAPADWKTALESRKLKRVLMMIAASLVGAWLLGVVAVVGGLLLENRRVAALETEVAALKKPAAEVEQMKQQVRSLERYAARTHSGLECLREVVALLPEGPELNAFTYKKYAEVNLRGEADSSGPIYDFFQALEKSPLFKEVKPEGVTQQARAGRVRSQFRVTLVLPAEEP